MNSIRDRGLRAVNVEQFIHENDAEYVANMSLAVPTERQYILRMLIKRPFQDFKIPSELEWIMPMLNVCINYQNNQLAIRQPYCYLTIRNGLVESITDDEWHTDGFSVNITHLPEQNYCWTDTYPTEFVKKSIPLPKDFSPFRHNIHEYIQDFLSLNPTGVTIPDCNSIYCFDPYVIHRRPQIPEGIKRAFVRLSFTPIEIMDDNNTTNPLIPMPKYNRDAVKEVRNKLERYPVKTNA